MIFAEIMHCLVGLNDCGGDCVLFRNTGLFCQKLCIV